VRELLPDLFGRIADYLAERPLYREFVGEMLHIRLEGGSESTRDRSLGRAARRLIAAGVARGEITAPVRAEVLADLLLGALTTALGNWSASPSYDLRRELREAADALLVLFTSAPSSRGR